MERLTLMGEKHDGPRQTDVKRQCGSKVTFQQAMNTASFRKLVTADLGYQVV